MAMNKVQFQKGLSMAEFMDRYGSAEQCEQALMSWRWPQGFACPACASGVHSSFRRGTLLYLQCSACRHQSSLISGTIFEATKLPLTRWFVAMHLLTQAKNNVSALELMRHLGVSYRTAWPSSVVCTAARKETLFCEPRPRLPPDSSPPR